MPTKAKVAVLFTKPETVLQDYERLMELAKDEKDPGRWAQICEVFSQAGQVVWLRGCRLSTRQERGPWSATSTARVPG